MNILLLYPEFPDTFLMFKHALKFAGKRSISPPLGLLTVAALLPAAWEKRLVDLNAALLTDADLAWADLVFVSAMVVQRESAHTLIQRLKQAGATVVAGGPLFTMEPDGFPEVDHLVLHEAELTLPRFLADLAAGQPQRRYTDTAYADIRQTPAPLWHLANLAYYDVVNVQFSRGCPFHCDFCNITALLGHRPRTKTAPQLIAELDGLYQRGWRGRVFFVDDNFIGNKKTLKEEILPALIAWRRGKRGLPFNTEASINLSDDPELMRLMAKAGFDTVFVGIESANEDSLAECGKSQNRGRDLVASVRRLQRAGLMVEGGFIVGFDNDPPAIFDRQIDFIQTAAIPVALVGMLQAPVGTGLYARMQQEGRLLNQTSGNNSDGTTNIVPAMGLAALQAGYRKVQGQIYSPALYYERVKTLLREYNPPAVHIRLDAQNLVSLLRTSYHLGLLGVERFHYWGLIAWVLLRRPRLFPVAITLSALGYHLRRVSELNILKAAQPDLAGT